MDSFDDFELKPLSEGLGFHKKPLNLRESVRQSNLVERELNQEPPVKPPEKLLSFQKDTLKEHSTTYEDLLSSLAEPRKSVVAESIKEKEVQARQFVQSQVELSNTFPRTEQTLWHKEPELGNRVESDAFKAMEVEVPRSPMIPPQSDLFIKQDKEKPMEAPVRRGGHNSPAVSKWSETCVSLRSLFMDTLVVMAIALVFLLSLLWITKVDLASVWFSSRHDFATQISMGILYLAVFQMYMIIARSFFGRSLGEWTFDYQLGSEEQQNSSIYPVKVLFRAFWVMVTGFVVLPLISLIFRVDIAGKLSGLRLYEQKNTL
ncbi:MAG: hypothetical protein KDD50_06155 [Bdellovibrionales bacterium]|nr:hypothetical protein [Bdellovibrionales bacterium]